MSFFLNFLFLGESVKRGNGAVLLKGRSKTALRPPIIFYIFPEFPLTLFSFFAIF
jgi:hypothetical protein